MPTARSLSDEVIAREVGSSALARGRTYARTGRVLDVTVDDDGLVEGVVRGTRSKPYDVTVALGVPGDDVAWSECSCPLGESCKHVAAVLIVCRLEGAAEDAVAPASPAAPGWARAFDPLLPRDTLRSSTKRDTAQLALRVEPKQAGPSVPLTVQCRPVRQGKSGRWVQTGVSWTDLQSTWRTDFAPIQRSLLLQLQRLASGVQPYHYYGRNDWLDLGDAPPLVWQALTDLVDAGIPLVSSDRGPATVSLSTAPAELFLDVSAADEGGGLVVAPRLTLAGQEPTTTRIGFLGNPAHGLVLEQGSTGPTSRLLLAPLPRLTDPATLTWLQRQGPVVVPGADRDRFLAEYAPRLRRTIELTSTDDSVDFPEPSPPRLALALHHGGIGELGLVWSVLYAMGDRTVRVDPEAADDTGIRDTGAERALLAALPVASEPWAVRLGFTPGVPLVRGLAGIEAAEFCAEVVPGLERAGVEVTQTGERRDYRRSDSAPEIALSVSEIDGATDWFDLGVQVTLDGEPVPLASLIAALARSDPHLILPSGTYFALDRPELVRLAELIGEARLLQDRHREGRLRINVHQPSLWEDLVGCGVVDEQAARWTRAVEALGRLDQPAEVEPPDGLEAELRPYQQSGYAWLSTLWSVGVGGILADDMGLGKTLQALALICAVHEREPEPGRPFLVVAPTSVVSNWAHEAQRFAPGLRVVAIDQTERKRVVPLEVIAAEADVVITSYTLLRLDAEHYEAVGWRGLILDEAQFVKNHHSKTYACLRRLGVGFTVAMTGTPLENSLMDLWAMLSLSAPGMFPSPDKFTEYYRTPIERGEAPERLELLRRRIKPVLLRRTKDVVARELPDKQEQVLEVDLHARHARIYQTHLQRERQKVLGLVGDLDENRFTILRSLTVLRQLSLEAALIDEQYEGVPSAKIDLLAEMIPELVAEGHRALVFSQFTRFLGRVGDRLRQVGVPYSYLDGRTRNRAKVIEEFRSGGTGAFLISLKAGGFGLNLTEADYCFVCDPWWNPATEAQAVDRAHRIGQTRPVMVYRLVSRGTIEEKVMALKARKSALFSSVLSAEGLPSGALTSDDVRGLLER